MFETEIAEEEDGRMEEALIIETGEGGTNLVEVLEVMSLQRRENLDFSYTKTSNIS